MNYEALVVQSEIDRLVLAVSTFCEEYGSKYISGPEKDIGTREMKLIAGAQNAWINNEWVLVVLCFPSVPYAEGSDIADVPAEFQGFSVYYYEYIP